MADSAIDCEVNVQHSTLLSLIAACAVGATVVGLRAAADPPVPGVATLNAMTARFAPVDIGADLSGLSAADRQVLAKLIAASRIIDALFLRQVWGGNEGVLLNLLGDHTDLGQARLHYFLINKGGWSRLDADAPFIPGLPPKPPQANFYPAGATKADVEAWMTALPEADRARAAGFFTTIRRDQSGKFIAVPYSVEYQGELTRMSELLREAAARSTNPTLKAFLSARADAFVTNDYYPSDLAWMELDSAIEPTIGPYEVYEDEWFNAKAAFESFITVGDAAESQNLARFGAQLQDIENHLPIDPKHRNPQLGALAPIRVVDVVFAAGDGNRGVQTAAYNLPNDERVVHERGSKRVMLKNMQEAKFEKALVPIARRVLAPADRSRVAFEPFFTHILMHELMHGLGPHNITVNGRKTTVRQELKETYSTIEEAKADVSGLFALQYLIDKGVLDKSMEQALHTTFLASAFRAVRFGVNEAHGRGMAIQLNYLLDYGAFVAEPDGTFAVNAAKIKDGVKALTHDLMTLQAEGGYAKAKDMITRLGVVRPEVRKALDGLQGIPVDIEPRFTTAEKLEEGQ